MFLNDELSWMNLVRRVRFYLPNGQFYDSDFDGVMKIKQIKKIIGLIASIKKPFNLVYEDKELPINNEDTLNSLFKEKSFDEIIIIQINLNSKSKNKKGHKRIRKEKNTKNENNANIHKKISLKDIEKENKYISVFKNYINNRQNAIINNEEKETILKKKQKSDNKNLINRKLNYNNLKEESEGYRNNNKNNIDFNNNISKAVLLQNLAEKIKLSGIYKNVKSSSSS